MDLQEEHQDRILKHEQVVKKLQEDLQATRNQSDSLQREKLLQAQSLGSLLA